MNTLCASRTHGHTSRVRFTAGVGLSIAVAVCAVACSKEAPSQSNPDQAVAGMPAVNGAAGMTPSAAGGAGANGTAQAGAGASAMSAAGRSGAGGDAGARPPGSGGAGSVAMGGRAGAGGTPAAGGSGGMQAAGGSSGTVGAGGCTRDLLKSTVDTYFAALAAHDPKMLPTAASVKFTENGKTMMLGEGLWAKAGMVKWKESLLDTQKCGTVTQAVVPDGTTDIPLAVRLKLEAQKITEVQTIAVRDGDYFVASNTNNMIALMPWGDIVPEDQRQTREQLEKWIDKYFRQFPMGICALSNDCKRMENGFTLMCSVGASCTSQEPSGNGVMQAQIILADVEASMAAGFTMFQGQYSDVHMVKYSGGMVHGVHTVLARAPSSGWD